MSLTAFHRFQQLAQEEHVVFYYTGYFSQSIIMAMGDALRQRINMVDASQVNRRRLFSIFVEMAQNVIHYSAEHLTDAATNNSEIRRGALWVGERDGRFFIVCANPIDSNNVDRVRAKLEPLREMTNDDIKQLYKTKLRTENEDTSKGAGLGFLTVARDATEPIEFDFVDEPGPSGPSTVFYLKATI